ncbi:MAG: hypothetical protein AAF573_14990 [Bacteroidota bacterium]
MNARNILAVVAVILALLLGWMWMRNATLSGKVTEIESQNKKLTEQIGDLEIVRDELQAKNDSLLVDYDELSEENALLATSVEEEKARVRRRNATIKKLKAAQEATVSNTSSLQAQISALLAAQKQLEANIADLQAENADLKEKLGTAEANLLQAQNDNAALDQLNKAMQAEIANLTLANFKATAFQVEMQKRRNEKVTAKSRLARRIKTSFDLANVPEEYQGVRPLYLVITDKTSNPIYIENPIKATVTVNGSNSEIIAAEKKEINIKANQRVEFNHKLGKRLKKGFYRIVVYTDIGVLGASTIRLR